jgi:hypothetical protein
MVDPITIVNIVLTALIPVVYLFAKRLKHSECCGSEMDFREIENSK